MKNLLKSILPRKAEKSHRVCPWWVGYILVSPLRRWLQAPEEILSPFISEGMNVLDIGCGMGFFSLPVARLVGENGNVVCVDLQEKMIKGLIKRATKAGLSERIDARTCRADTLGVDDVAGKIDFALAFAVVHEVPDKERFLTEIRNALKETGKLLISEPSGHVSEKEFDKTIVAAQSLGFQVINRPAIKRSRSVLMGK
ncbi:MAG TPA: class I SAM-dependent methyltransferase [Thermodesulfovibrionales bacterium]|nr:class I SAM-dependent methyltransferase [Thermodesulfovibrionales bacterium]